VSVRIAKEKKRQEIHAIYYFQEYLKKTDYQDQGRRHAGLVNELCMQCRSADSSVPLPVAMRDSSRRDECTIEDYWRRAAWAVGVEQKGTPSGISRSPGHSRP
jgi:hypothetical protein